MRLFRMPPARSPLTLRALMRAMTKLSGGDPVEELGALLTERYAAERVLLYASGTHALTVALRAAARARPGKPVLLPAYTCFEVATAAVAADVSVALYDLDASTLEPDWTSVRRAGAEGAAALVVAPLYGMIVDWTEARAVADALGAPLIEDAAQAHGSTWRDAPVGGAGDLSILSFGRGKGWTGAGGGALLARGAGLELVANESPAAVASNATRSALAAAAQWLLSPPALYTIPASIPALRLGETIYHEPTPVRGMNPFSCALVLATDAIASAEARHRQRVGAEYGTLLEERAPLALCGRLRHPTGSAGALRFPTLLPGGWRDARETQAARLGAGPPYPDTLAGLSALRPRIRNPGEEHPVASRLVQQLVTLPTHASTRQASRRALADLIVASAQRVASTQQVGEIARPVETALR